MRPILPISAVLGLTLLTVLSSGSAGQQDSVTPGSRAPQLSELPASVLDVELRSARGRPFKLSDYSGKVLVINLWATWLGPSRLETPALVKLQAHYWSRGVRFVGLSTENPDQSAKLVRGWVRTFRIQYKIGWSPEAVTDTLLQGRNVLPQTYVISPTGHIVRHYVGFNPIKTPADLKEAIEEALNERQDTSHITAP